MNEIFQNALKIIYAFLEQVVFYVAAVVAFLCWVSFGNMYLAIAVFILICLFFWAIPSIVKRNK